MGDYDLNPSLSILINAGPGVLLHVSTFNIFHESNPSKHKGAGAGWVDGPSSALWRSFSLNFKSRGAGHTAPWTRQDGFLGAACCSSPQQRTP